MGRFSKRNVGESDHGKLQREFIYYFRTREESLDVYIFPEQRVQISKRRFRIPDLCLVPGPEPDDLIFYTPPLVCIEILSKDDTLERMQERIDDYLTFGVRYVWVVDPRTRRAWIYTNDGSQEVMDGVLRTESPIISVPLADLFRRPKR